MKETPTEKDTSAHSRFSERQTPSTRFDTVRRGSAEAARREFTPPARVIEFAGLLRDRRDNAPFTRRNTFPAVRRTVSPRKKPSSRRTFPRGPFKLTISSDIVGDEVERLFRPATETARVRRRNEIAFSLRRERVQARAGDLELTDSFFSVFPFSIKYSEILDPFSLAGDAFRVFHRGLWRGFSVFGAVNAAGLEFWEYYYNMLKLGNCL